MTTTEFDQETGTRKRDKVREKAGAIRGKAGDAYSAARERTSAAYGNARERVGDAGRRTSENIDANPVAALIGGLALGAIAAALLPKTRREEEMLGQYGRRINETAREAARAAREAGKSKLDELGYNRDAAREKIQVLREDVKEVASAAAQRARETPRQQ